MVNKDCTFRLRELAAANQVTLYVVILSAFQVLLHRHCAQEEVLVGSPTSGRSDAELEHLIGYFVNPVVLRTSFSGDPTVKEVLARVGKTVLSC